MCITISSDNANVNGAHALSGRATSALRTARVTAEFLGCANPAQIIWGGVTDAINLVAASWGRSNLAAGDMFCPGHGYSDIVPWQLICAERGLK